MSGLPSGIDIPFTNYEILKLAKRMGSLSEFPTDKEEDKILLNYWNFSANHYFKLMRKYKVDMVFSC